MFVSYKNLKSYYNKFLSWNILDYIDYINEKKSYNYWNIAF